MSLSATIECGDALIVFEGAPAIHANEVVDVRGRLDSGHPILIVLGGRAAAAALLPERFAAAPPALAAVAHSIAHDLAGVPAPALDWLPVELRTRGLRFLRTSTD